MKENAMTNLNSKEIKTLIKGYIQEKSYPYAIMIDGSWGSGKTYFVKNQLIPDVKCLNIESIYVSLYGVRNEESITKQIYCSIIEGRIFQKVNKKVIPTINFGLRTVQEFIGNWINSDEVKNLNLAEVFSPFIDYKKYFFIFDDLERCPLPANVILGYINQFVEQYTAKVLIIANQIEIGKNQLEQNLEIRYLISTQEAIDWPQKGNKVTLNKDELDKRISYLFTNSNEYIRIREKIIGQILYFSPDLREIVPVVFDEYFSICHELLKNKSVFINSIIQLYEKKKYNNIRTLQFSLRFFKKIFSIIVSEYKGKYSDEVIEKVLVDILNAIILVSIYNKKGYNDYKWDIEMDYGMINFDKDRSEAARLITSNYFLSFKFVHKYIYEFEFNAKKILMTLNKYIKSKEKGIERNNDPTEKLRYYWIMEDNDILDKLKDLYAKLKEDKYTSDNYQWILSLVYVLKGIGYEPVDANLFVNYIRKSVEAGNTIQNCTENAMFKESPCYDEYCKVIEELKILEKQKKNEKYKKNINSIFELKAGWGVEVYKYYNENKEQIYTEGMFFGNIDIEKCIDKIKEASVDEFFNFRRSLFTIYDTSKFLLKSDKSSLEQFLRRLKETDLDGIMKNYTKNFLQQDIEKLVDLVTD